MPLDARLRQRLEQALGVVDDHGTAGPRLLHDALRLGQRVEPLVSMTLVPAEGLDRDALELACYSLQLPLRRSRTLPTGKPQRSTVRERAEESAELLLGVAGGGTHGGLVGPGGRVAPAEAPPCPAAP